MPKIPTGVTISYDTGFMTQERTGREENASSCLVSTRWCPPFCKTWPERPRHRLAWGSVARQCECLTTVIYGEKTQTKAKLAIKRRTPQTSAASFPRVNKAGSHYIA